jgi:hypothetical protein
MGGGGQKGLIRGNKGSAEGDWVLRWIIKPDV